MGEDATYLLPNVCGQYVCDESARLERTVGLQIRRHNRHPPVCESGS